MRPLLKGKETAKGLKIVSQKAWMQLDREGFHGLGWTVSTRRGRQK